MNMLEGIEHSAEPEDLLCYGYDASGLDGSPALVVWPKNTEEVVGIMKYASGNGMSVVPRGAGTGMTGGSVPGKDAIVVSFEKMNRLLEVDAEDLYAVVEPGLINGRFQRELDGMGFFYPPDPSSLDFCTIGGNVAENAGGPRAIKYGVTRDYVMELEAVLPSGEVINTGVKTRKGVVGYDLVRLLVGSEGTLALITKIRLKVLPRPEEIVTLLASFEDVVELGRAVSGIIAAGIIPRAVEFMDREAVRAVEKFRPSGLFVRGEAMLLIELDGEPSSIKKDAERVLDICKTASVKMAGDREARERLWECRRSLSPALYRLNPTKINEDIVVPRSRLPEMLDTLRGLSSKSGISIVNFGHAGDGNIHVNIMADKKDAEKYVKAQSLVKDVFRAALSFGGTISGEHGVGLTKKPYLDMEIKGRELALMKGIKGLFDPKNILNPGKIFPL